MTTGGLFLSPVLAEALGKLLGDESGSFPRVLRVKGLSPLHNRECVEQQLVHAGSEGLHPSQGPVWPLDQSVEVSPDPRVVLQTR